ELALCVPVRDPCHSSYLTSHIAKQLYRGPPFSKILCAGRTIVNACPSFVHPLLLLRDDRPTGSHFEHSKNPRTKHVRHFETGWAVQCTRKPGDPEDPAFLENSCKPNVTRCIATQQPADRGVTTTARHPAFWDECFGGTRSHCDLSS